MLCLVPLVVIGKLDTVQFVVATLVFCWRTKPLEGYGHETSTLLPPGVIDNNGAPGVCTGAIKLQKPPVTEKSPPLIAPLASAWPIVPLT